jgi:uncharacterized protein YbjT (DUF2867 family)
MQKLSPRILITGATGKIGGRVLGGLDASVSVRAFSRNANAADLPDHIETMEGDLTDIAALETALIGIDCVFLLLPFLTAEQARPVVDAIARHGTRIVYLSTAGAGDPADRTSNPISATHYAVEQMIEQSIEKWTMVRPTSFASNTLMFWTDQVQGGDTVYWPLTSARLSVIHDGDIAAVITKVLIDTAYIGQRLLITGPAAITPADELAAIGAALDKSLTLVELPTQTAREHMLKSGMPAPIVDGVLGYWTRRTTEPEITTLTIDSVLGRPAQSFEVWANENASKFI